MIAEHKAREKEFYRLSRKLDEAKFQAEKIHGKRLADWIWWRHCNVLSEARLGDRREEFLGQPGADREQIEKEYQDAKARLAAAVSAALEWDHRAGIAPLREQYEGADLAERKAAMQMARTKPTTAAGAGALVAYARRDIMHGAGPDWPIVALKTAAAALIGMSEEASE